MRTALLLLIFLVQLFDPSSADTEKPASRPLATYDRFLPLAIAGDVDIQHFIGYMFFYGEGVDQSYDDAHYWFHLAAEEGDPRAQRNLGIFHSRAVSGIPEKFYAPEEANRWFSLVAAGSDKSSISTLASHSYGNFLALDAEKVLSASKPQQVGKTIFVTYCAGCHGFDGHAAYPQAPSFALGERLGQSDDALIDSILSGKGSMSSWNGTLTRDMVWQSVRYIRGLQAIYGKEEISNSVNTDSENQVARNRKEQPGEAIYPKFCGGCHGFNGIAWYVNSPSFALRERLEKTDAELANSIKNGLGEMPSWEYMLSPQQIAGLVTYIRGFADKYEEGITNELQQPPEHYLQFRAGLVKP